MMAIALDEAKAAFEAGEVPVGAVVVADGKVIGRGRNRTLESGDPTQHAEMVALRDALAARPGRIPGTTLYVTLEPCAMCAGAILLARVDRVVYGCDDPKAGAARTLFTLLSDTRLNHRCQVEHGVLAVDCSELLSRFFRELRARGPRVRSANVPER